MSHLFYRTWYVRLIDNISFPFFQTTRRDHTTDALLSMMPKRGIGGYLIPVVGEVPAELKGRMEHHRGKPFVSIAQAEVSELWFVDDLPPAERLRLYDVIQASTTEST